MKLKHLPKVPDLKGRGKLSCDLPASALARWNAGLQAKAEDDAETVIAIYDPIGNDFWGEGVTAKRIAAQLRAAGERNVVVNINSPGGDVFEGIAIYNLLRDHPGDVTVRVVGVAASAASLIAMAGDEIQMARSGFMMLHNIWVVAIGDRNALRDSAKLLESFDDAVADVYAARAGIDKTEAAKMMDVETWLGSAAAIDQGFADGLVPADEIEEKEPQAALSNDIRMADMALARYGLPRADRRALLNRIKQSGGTPGAAAPNDGGTPDAASQATLEAGKQVLQNLTDLFGSAKA